MNNRTPDQRDQSHHAPALGLAEWFRPGDFDRVEAVLDDLKRLHLNQLRFGLDWAEGTTREGQAFYDWLFPRLAREVLPLPCLTYHGLLPARPGRRLAAPPGGASQYADFLAMIVAQYGNCFEWIELAYESRGLPGWELQTDSGFEQFCTALPTAAERARQAGKRVVLGGLRATDLDRLAALSQRGVLHPMDALGLQRFPGTWDEPHRDWAEVIDQVQQLLAHDEVTARVWITETGYSTWRHDEFQQLLALAHLLEAPVERAYWTSDYDLSAELPNAATAVADERQRHLGLKQALGQPKLLLRTWAERGLAGVRELAAANAPAPVAEAESARPALPAANGARAATNGHRQPTASRVLITGGAGFIGTNLAHRLLSSGRKVLLFDNLSRPGVEANLNWLRSVHGERVQVEIADTRNAQALHRAIGQVEQIFHLAAQVAVTTSLVDPLHDFEVNVRGTLNLLEAMRRQTHPPQLVFTSTNKVYGALADLEFREKDSRHEPLDRHIRQQGIGEGRPLDFHSPYGCSKGAADQYILDYARIYRLPTVVFRMSCIYGPHQHGTEDQGWVAHFLIRKLMSEPVTIYGDGKQVRDILFVEDLVNAFLLAQARMDRLAGQAFNIGGGTRSTISLIELMELIKELDGEGLSIQHAAWRPGDQKYYVSDIHKFSRATGWEPQVGVREGVTRLYEWLLESSGLEIRALAREEGLLHGNHRQNAKHVDGKPSPLA